MTCAPGRPMADPALTHLSADPDGGLGLHGHVRLPAAENSLICRAPGGVPGLWQSGRIRRRAT
jgi:hypothetical protein